MVNFLAFLGSFEVDFMLIFGKKFTAMVNFFRFKG